MAKHCSKKLLASTILASASILVCLWFVQDRASIRKADAAATGPLRVLASNPRYFTDGSGKAILLTGSHTWCNLANRVPPAKNSDTCILDWSAYLNFLTPHNHNFIRMWTFELLGMEMLPWQRSGPGTANDGNLKVNFKQFNQTYFDNLRSRVIDARDRGIYVGIMLFDGSYSQGLWDDHTMNPANNAQGIDGGAEARRKHSTMWQKLRSRKLMSKK